MTPSGATDRAGHFVMVWKERERQRSARVVEWLHSLNANGDPNAGWREHTCAFRER